MLTPTDSFPDPRRDFSLYYALPPQTGEDVVFLSTRFFRLSQAAGVDPDFP